MHTQNCTKLPPVDRLGWTRGEFELGPGTLPRDRARKSHDPRPARFLV